MTELDQILSRLLAPEFAGGVLATLVDVQGSSYRRAGARMLVTEQGRDGSISGGCLEEDITARAADVMRASGAERVTYDTTAENDLVWGVGLGCHGVVQVLLEPIPAAPPWAGVLAQNQATQRVTKLATVWQADGNLSLGTRLAEELPPTLPARVRVLHQTIESPQPLIIFGAGDDAQPLAALAAALGWNVVVADSRPAYATPARFPQAARVVHTRAEELVAAAGPVPQRAAVVVMTHRYRDDVPILRALLAAPVRYVGLLGPKARAERLLADLAQEGASVSTDFRQRLHAPVGLDVGAETREEIAVSILAEIQAVLSRRDGRPLRERDAPIHE